MPKRIKENPPIKDKKTHTVINEKAGIEAGCFGYLFRFFVSRDTKIEKPNSPTLDTPV